jgi:PAS domain S-box-containing protein
MSAKNRGGAAANAEKGWEALFWGVFRRSTNPILLLDERRRLLELNDPAVALIGQTRGELLGTELAERFPPAERDTATRDWRSLLRAGEGVGSRVLVRPDGSSVEFEWAARLAHLGGRRVVLAVWIGDAPRARRARVGECSIPLTRREREVTTLIALGHETRAIAASLHISPETVKSHVRNAMSKLCAHTRAQLVALALSGGQIAQVPHLGETAARG